MFFLILESNISFCFFSYTAWFLIGVLLLYFVISWQIFSPSLIKFSNLVPGILAVVTEPFPTARLQGNSPMWSSGNFQNFIFTFRSLIQLKFILIHGVVDRSSFIFFQISMQLSLNHFFKKTVFISVLGFSIFFLINLIKESSIFKTFQSINFQFYHMLDFYMQLGIFLHSLFYSFCLCVYSCASANLL